MPQAPASSVTEEGNGLPDVADGSFAGRFGFQDGVLLHGEPAGVSGVEQVFDDSGDSDVPLPERNVHAGFHAVGVGDLAALDPLGNCLADIL